MKRSYREGDWFAVPLGDGRVAVGIIVHVMHHLLDVACYGPASQLATARDRCTVIDAHQPPALVARISDRGLLLQRWPRIYHAPHFTRAPWPQVDAATRGFLTAPMVERRLARALTDPAFDDAPRFVRDLGIEPSHELLEALPLRTTLQWRDRLSRAALSAIEAWLHARPHARIRLCGDALGQLDVIADWEPLRHVAFGTRMDCALPSLPQVRTLVCEEHLASARIAAACPNLRRLRVEERGSSIDVRALEPLQALTLLDISESRVEHLADLARLPSLRALRLYRTTGWENLDALGATTLQMLAIEHHAALADLLPLAALRTLEQLELRGLWQFNVDDLDWLFGLPRLHRVSVDIGGRRKNVELYRRAHWAYAWPFETLGWE